MRRTEQAQGLRLMKFEEVYGRLRCGVLSQAEAAEVLGMSERNFRRWQVRYEADGAEGLYDRRLGRVSARRAPVDEVMTVLELFDSRYWDLGVKHLQRDAGRRARVPAQLQLAQDHPAGARADPSGAASRRPPAQAAAPAFAGDDAAPGRLAP